MPELPEVETMRRGILGVVGSTIADVQRVACKLKPILIQPRISTFRRRAVGCTVIGVDRVGKRVIIRLDSGDAIVMEPRMTGLVLVADPPNLEHLRFSLEFTGGEVEQALFWDRRGLGSVRLLSPRQFERQLGSEKLGPDALATTPDVLRSQFCKSKREVKPALLDQRAIAGIGNLYASEILHVARVHPAARCDRLTRVQWTRIHEAIIAVLNEAIRYEGSTLGDGTYRNALNQQGGYQNCHRVYNRQEKLCPSCRTDKIQRIVQTQRSTFFCPTCQTKRHRRHRITKPR